MPEKSCLHTVSKLRCQNYFHYLSLLWQALMCRRMLPRRLNDFEQRVHWKGFSPVCISRCCFRFLCRANFLWQYWHSWIFLPEWMIKWHCRWLSWLNDFRHTVHWWGFSPVCVSMCRLRSPRSEKPRWQVLHLNGFSPMWVNRCCLSALAYANFLWQ